MPLLSCILCLANHALLSGLCYLLLKLVVYVSKKPLWVEHMPSLNRVNPKDFTSHTYLVLHQVKLSTTNAITERKTRNKSIKFLKVKWSHHSDQEDTWEREDHLRSEYPEFFQS